MYPYHQMIFVFNFIRIKGQTITGVNGQELMAVGLGNMPIELPNGNSMLWIPLKEVLYVPNMGATLISTSKITGVGFKMVFHKDFLGQEILHMSIMVQKCPYRVEHGLHKVSASVTMDMVTIEKPHQIMGHISLEVARKLG